MNENLISELKNELQKVIDKECWGVVAGMGTGSVVSFNIGDKFLREKPLKNSNLTEIVRNHEAEYGFLVFCAWRLDSEKEVVCGCWDDNREDQKMLAGLDLLVRSTITGIHVSEPGYDLSISFSNQLKLKMFCDQVNEYDEQSNYHFFTPQIIYTVGCRSVLTAEERDEKRSL